ncbi:MAG: 50S ribosomal protein L15 [Legionellales bacterium]|nr:50S ribosomal protein L15 [Legionellales bacterium]
MRLNTLKPGENAKKKKVRVGRGWSSGCGKTCGKGVKGQKARGSGKVAIGFEGGQMPFHRRVPKSGFTSRKAMTRAEVRLSELNKLYVDVVDLLVLKEHNVIGNNIETVKIIATGEIDKAVTLRGILVSKGAKEAIENAGGKVEN